MNEANTANTDTLEAVAAAVEAAEASTPVAQKRRGRRPNPNSGLQRATVLYTSGVAAGLNRQQILETFVSELNITPNSAKVYYSNAKNAGKPKQTRTASVATSATSIPVAVSAPVTTD